MKNSRYEKGNVSDSKNWETMYFTPGETQAIMVFYNRVHDKMYYEENGNLRAGIIEKLLNEIEIGLWDSYLFWDYAAHQNMLNQNMLATLMSKMLSSDVKNNSDSSAHTQAKN